MPTETIPGAELRYHLLSLDEDGNERNDDPDGRMSDRIKQAMHADKPTDVFVFIHGWKGDLDAARSQYVAWMSTLMELEGDLARARARRPGFVPLLVGLHWPSLPFGNESLGEGESFDAGVDANANAPTIDEAVEEAAPLIADTPAARTALRIIFEAVEQVAYAPTSLPPAVAEAYQILDRESGLGAEGVDPGTDREVFDPEVAYKLGQEDPASFGGGGAGKALLSPLVQLSFWKMKARAKRVGESGGFAILGLREVVWAVSLNFTAPAACR